MSLYAAIVIITVTPPAQVFAGNDTAVTTGQPLKLQAFDINNSGFSQFTWSPSNGLSNPNIQDPEAKLDKSMDYIVTASTPAGCEGMDTINIKVYERPDIFVPNAFTPNGDGHNDVLKAIPVGIKVFNYIVIYNRWGQQVFQSSNPAMGWDGKVNGIPQGSGTFVWMATGIDYVGRSVERRGVLFLIR